MKTQKQRIFSIVTILTMAIILTCILVACNGSTSSQNHGNTSRFKAEYYVNGELWKTSDKNEDLDYPIIKGKELFLGWYTDEFYFDSYNKAEFNSSKLYSNIEYYGKTVSFSDYLMRLSCLQKDGLDVYSRFNLTADVGDITLKLRTTYDSPLNPFPVLTCEWASGGEIVSTMYYIEDSKMNAYYVSLSNSSFVKAEYRVVYDPEKTNEDEHFCSDFYLVDSSGDTFALTSSVQKVIKSFALLSCTALHRFATEAEQNPSETIYTVASFYEHIGRIIYFNDGKAEKDQWYDLSDTVEMYTPSIEDLNKVFEGWYLDSNFKTKFTEIDYDNAGTTVLYAKWTTTDNLLQEWALKYATGKKMMLPENSGKEDAYFTARNGVPYLEYEVYGDNEKAGKTAVSYNIKTNSFVMSLYDKNGIKIGSYSANYQISFTNFQWKSTVTNENITASTTDARKVLEQSKSAALEKIKNAYKFGHALVIGNRDTSSMGNFQLYPLSHKIFYVTDEAWTSFKTNNATYYLEGNDLTLAAGSLSNAAFAGWYLDEKHTKKVEKISSSDDRDLILYPLFYTVSVSKNENAGGNVRMPSNLTIGTECTITASANSGYTFTGWYIGDEKVSDDTSYTFVMSEENKSFVAHFEPNTYNVLFDANGGECDESSFAVSYNRQYSHALPIPTRQGYNFDGWYYSNALFASSGTYLYAKDITLTAKWTARTDTRYIVKHWQQSLTDEYVVFETQQLQGRTDSNVTPSVKRYVGFSSPATKIARIMPDGTTVIDYYYLRNSYTISFVTNGGNAIGEMTRKFESELFLPMAVRGVDIFGGWFMSALLDNNFTDTIMPANDIVLYAWWAEENKAVDFGYTESDEYVTINSYNGTVKNVHIPEFINDKIVSIVGENAFKNESIVEMVLPSRINSILKEAFYNCSALKKVTFLGNDCALLDSYAFAMCSALSQFNSDKEGALVVPSSCSKIGSYAFNNLVLITDVTVPDSVTSIGGGAFKGCSGLVNITLPFVGASKTASNGYDQVFGYIFDYTTSSSSSLVYQYPRYYYYIPKTIKSVTVTKQTAIPKYAFRNCDFIESITIPQDVTSIGDYTFAGCSSLTSVSIAEGVTSIGSYAFSECSKISKFNSDKEGALVVPSSCSKIGSYAFNNLVLITDVTVPDSVTAIGGGAFKGCSGLVNITLPFVGASKTASNGYDQVFGYIFDYTTSSSSSLVNQYPRYYYYIPKTIKSVTVTKQTAIPQNAFRNCDFIESITIPQDVTSIGSYAFADCKKLKMLNSKVEGEFNIPQSVTTINQYAFSNCLLATKVTLSDNVTSIGDHAFYGCSLLSKFNSGKEGAIVVPSSCSAIGSYAFNNLVLITDVTVPDSVTAIGGGAFKGCSGLVNITLPFVGASKTASNGYDQVFGYIFDYTTSSSSSLVNQYSGYYYHIPKTIKSVTVTKQTVIPKYAFKNCDFIESITIPQDVTSIGDYTFAGCKKLKTLNSKVEGEFNIPQSVTTINQDAFNNCLLATKVTLPDNVTSIGDYAFAGCSMISQFNSDNQGELFAPKNCEKIGAYAFAEFKLIEKVCVGDIVYGIGAAAFSKMVSLKEIVLPFVGSSNVSSKNTYQYPLGYVFGTSSYTGETATKQYFYGSSISSFTSETYYIPTTLQKVTITLGDLNYGAFYNCSNITEVIVSQDTVVDEKALYACSAAITRIDYTATNYSWNGRDIATAYNSGDGSETNPYIISNGDELAFFAQQVNNGESYEGVYFKLSQNIYMANKAFKVIGNDTSYFKGVFDGNGFAIKAVSITSTAQNVGLFGKTSGTIKNLRLLSTTINSNSTENQSTAGLLVGHLLEGGTVSNCSAQGTITAKCQLTLYCGGLIGYNDGSVDNSSASVKVSATSTSLMVYAGGLIGYNNGDVIDSTASGTVSASGYNEEYTHKGDIFGFNSKA